MICRLIFLFYCLGLGQSVSQNLVINGDFENRGAHKTAAEGWSKGHKKHTPDYFNDSLSEKMYRKYRGGTSSQSGKAHVGLFVFRGISGQNNEIREVLCGKLLQPLKRDSFYKVSFYLKADEESNIESDGFALHFSRESLENLDNEKLYDLRAHVMLKPGKPIKKQNDWTLVGGNYRASGGEAFIVAGNLKPDANTAKHSSAVVSTSKKDKWYLKEGEQVAYFYLDNMVMIPNDSLNKDAVQKALLKKLKKERALAVKDSLRKLKDSLQLAGKQPMLKEPAEPALGGLNAEDISEGAAINLPMIQFEVGKADFKPAAMIHLEELLNVMKKNSTLEIEVRGHTDNSGKETHNQKLSRARAEAVKDYLVKNGIDVNRLRTSGFGSSQPLESNDTEEGKAKNRRIEIYILHE